MTKPHLKTFFAIFLLFFCAFILNAQTLLAPSYSVQAVKGGFVYTFSVKSGELVCYRVYDSFTGKVTGGFAQNGENLAINYNDSVSAWCQNAAGTRSKEILLSKNPNQNQNVEIISPVEGIWANRQSLVLNVPAGTEVFYSFWESDPLDFGFAYDEPVLIDLTGDVKLSLAIVSASGNVEKREINYTVNENKNLRDPIPYKQLEAFVDCGVRSPIPLPQNALFSFSDEIAPNLKGRTLYQQFPSCVDSLLPLVVSSNNQLYRYVLRTRDAPQTDISQQQTISSPIQIVDWNFVSFPSGQQIFYSVDGTGWRLYVEPFYIDRSKTHRIAWKTNTFSDFVDLPAKPTILGVPKNGITNAPVELHCSNSLYTFRIEDHKGVSKPLTSFYVDTIYGDSRQFSLNLAIYYGNIRQGEIPVNFTIDKCPPEAPKLKIVNTEEYFRNSAMVAVSAGEKVFTAIDEERSYIDFYAKLDDIQSAEAADELSFFPLVGSKINLEGDDEYAVTYTVYAYTQDSAGNKSETVACRAVVDNNNFYLDSSAGDAGDGSPNAPFSTFAEALRCANCRDYTVLHLRGAFSQSEKLNLLRDLRLIADDSALLAFDSESCINIKACDFSAFGIVFEKSAVEENFADYIFAEPIIKSENSKLTFDACELVYTGSAPNGVLMLSNGSFFAQNTGITMQNSSSALGLVAQDSKIVAENFRVSGTGDMISAFSLSNSSLELFKVRYMLAAKRPKGAELFGCNYYVDQSAMQNFADYAGSFIPVWKDSSSIESRLAWE